MNVAELIAELIAELQRHPPGKVVRVLTRTVYMTDEAGSWEMPTCAEDALEADEVRNEGAFVMVWGGRA
ncbi:MAG TPA: hypothetical protein VF555_16460 [Variovorax sp.]